MSQMFSPFFSHFFTRHCKNAKKMRILRCCIHALQFSRHHAPVTLESPRHPQREKTRNSEKVIFWRCTYNATEKKIVYLRN